MTLSTNISTYARCFFHFLGSFYIRVVLQAPSKLREQQVTFLFES